MNYPPQPTYPAPKKPNIKYPPQPTYPAPKIPVTFV